MGQALDIAAEALAAGDVPVGAMVISAAGDVLGVGNNQREANGDPTAHAEVVALRAAASALGTWRLQDCTLVVTLEPCVMCAGALINARLRLLVFGARDLRFGGVRSKFRLADSDLLNHSVEVTEGVLGVECVELLQEFFRSRR